MRQTKVKKDNRKKDPVRQQATSRKRTLKLPFIPVYILLFLMLWIFMGCVYDNVFYIAQQNTYFAFNELLMHGVMDTKFGWMTVIGRVVLLPFHYPLLGGFLMALLLTITAWLLDYVLRLRGWARIVPPLLPLFYMGFIVFKGLNLFYQENVAYKFAVPLLLFVVVAVAAVVTWLLAKKPLSKPWMIGKNAPKGLQIAGWGTLSVVFVALMVYAVPFRTNTLATVKMQRLMERGDWEGMIKAALKVDLPGRPVCCYYAIALAQTDQLDTRLFDIHYQYPNLRIHNRKGEPEGSTEYYAADGDFFAGLINTSYHDCMERCVIDGYSIMLLKRMYLCALLNEEPMLAHRYLNMISKMPFEGAFVKKYGPMLYDKKLLAQDVDLSKVYDVMPVEDTFEQWYRTPLFIGYNVMLTSGKGYRALNHSMAACLYAKELNSFFERTQPLLGQSLSKTFEEALVLYGLKNKVNPEGFSLSPFTTQKIQTFLSSAVQYKGEDRKEVYYKLKDQYENFYPFYYYFQNIPDKNYVFKKKESGGVN